MIRAPRPIAPKFAWFNKLRSFAKSSQIQPGAGYRVERTTAGTTIKVRTPVSAGGKGTPLELFQIVSIEDEYLSCHKVSDMSGSTPTVGTALFNVEKPFKLRRTSWDNKTITIPASAFSVPPVNVQIRYAWAGKQERTATLSGAVENQVITPRYLVGDILIASPITASEHAYSDVNADGRAWAKV